MTHHVATLADGRTLDIVRLVCLVQRRPPEPISFSQLKGISRSRQTGFSKKRLERANTAIPGIVDQDNRILDGRHRVLKLRASGVTYGLFWKVSPEDIQQAIIDSNED